MRFLPRITHASLCMLVVCFTSRALSDMPKRQNPVSVAENTMRLLTVAENGVMKADVIIPDDCGEQVQNAAELLSDYFETITGSAPAILADSAPRQAPLGIHVGRTVAMRNLPHDFSNWDEDEFLITAPDADTLLLVGATTRATEYAVYELLERFCGVRWLFPGELGTEIPKNPSLQLKIETVHERPAYLSRRLSAPPLWGDYQGPRGRRNRESDLAIWARRHRHNGRVDYGHSLGRRIFKPEQFAETHPEIFPVVDGKRLIPLQGINGTSRGGGWQPCFTHSNTLKIGLNVVLEALRAMPEGQKTFALGVNDRGGHCTCDACRALDGTRLNVINCADHSRSYFTWANALAKGVAAEFPAAKLGFLAYSGVAEPPENMSVHPSLVPYITSDRMKWMDPEARARDIAVHRRWQAAVPEVGWYDYIYGSQYKVPRVYFHLMADYLRWGHAEGVRYYTAEAYPADDWHEGPKMSLTLALLWNPALDVDAFLNDWYVAAVGPEAAPLLHAYFTFWETYWTTAVPRTAWFKDGRRLQYFLFRGTGYLEELRSEDVATLRSLVEQLPDLASKDKRERARFLADGMRQRLTELEVIVDRFVAASNLRPGTDEHVLIADTFDELAPQWSVWVRSPGEVVRTVMGEMDETKGVLRLNLAQSGHSPVHLMRSFDLPKQNKIYQATFRVKGVQISDPVTVAVRFKNEQKKTLPDLDIAARPLYLSSDAWQDATIVFQASEDSAPDAASFSVHLRMPESGKGFVFVDSFTLTESKPD